MMNLVAPLCVASVICLIVYLSSSSGKADGGERPNYAMTFLISFIVVAMIAFVFSNDNGTGSISGKAGGSLNALLKEIDLGDPDF